MLLGNDTMQAMVLETPSPDFTLTAVNVPVPLCQDQELLVKVHYVGLTHSDARFAKHGFCCWEYPRVLGLDAVGEVVHAPAGVFPRKGTKVMWHTSLAEQGVLSDYAKVPNYAVTCVPEGVDDALAASLPTAGMTAMIALEKVALTQGDCIFIDGGYTAVGQIAIQYAKARGARVVASSQPQHHGYLKQLGADHVVDYANTSRFESLKKEMPVDGFDAILDTQGGDVCARNLELLRFCGRIACLNGVPVLSDELLFRKAPNIHVVSLAGAWLANSLCAQQKLGFMGETLLKDVAEKRITPKPIELLPFDSKAITHALNELASGQAQKRPVVQIL